MSSEKERLKYALFFGAAIVVFAADQISKWLVMRDIAPGHVIQVIPGFFDLIYARNRGAAFGFLNSPEIEWQFWLFLLATIIAVWAIFTLLKGASSQKSLSLGLGLIMGGALGNLVDRLRFRAVVDFLDFYLGDWHWPAFNIADCGICVGAFLTFVVLWKGKPQKDKP